MTATETWKKQRLLSSRVRQRLQMELRDFRVQTDAFLALLNSHGAWITGSLVLAALMDVEWSSFGVDVLYDGDDDFGEILKQNLTASRMGNGEYPYPPGVWLGRYLVPLDVEPIAVLQILSTTQPVRLHVETKTDFGFVRNLYDGKSLQILDMHSLRTRCSAVENPNCSTPRRISTRLCKYAERGFTFSLEYKDDILDPTGLALHVVRAFSLGVEVAMFVPLSGDLDKCCVELMARLWSGGETDFPRHGMFDFYRMWLRDGERKLVEINRLFDMLDFIEPRARFSQLWSARLGLK